MWLLITYVHCLNILVIFYKSLELNDSETKQIYTSTRFWKEVNISISMASIAKYIAMWTAPTQQPEAL